MKNAIEAIKEARATLTVAADDVAAGLKPYESNLRDAARDLTWAIKTLEKATKREDME
jgi:hypothetical protein